MPDLYHFTCAHSRRRIGTYGLLIPQVRHPHLGCKVLWLTTEAEPDREASGLGMHYQNCDRMEYRYLVEDNERCRPWLMAHERSLAAPGAVAELEQGHDPEHWWISSQPVMARLDRSWFKPPVDQYAVR